MGHPGAWHCVWLKRVVAGSQGVVKCQATSNLTTGTTEEGGRGLKTQNKYVAEIIILILGTLIKKMLANIST